MAATEPISSSTISASGLSKRNISTATGVSASTRPATSPAGADPVVRRTVACSSPTDATPISAWGTSRLHDESPKSLIDSAITQIEAGVLSTVMALAASEEPKNIAFQDSEPACAAAA